MKDKNPSSIVKPIVLILLIACLGVALYFLLTTKLTPRESNFEIWYSFPEGSEQAKYLESTVLSEFRKKNRTMTPTTVYISEEEIFSRLLAAKNEGNMPALVFLSPPDVAELSKYEVLMVLDGVDDEGKSFFENLSEITDALAPGVAAEGIINERRYALPISSSAQVLLYNPSILENAGVSPPSDIGSFWTACDTVSNSGGGASGYALPGYSLNSLAPFIWSGGGELVSDDRKKTYGYLNSPANVSFFEKFGAAVESGSLLIGESKEEVRSLFLSGKASMFLATAEDIAAIMRENPEFEFGQILFPSGAGGSVTVLDSYMIAIPVGTDLSHANDLIDIIFTPEALLALAPGDMYPSVRRAESEVSPIGSPMAEAVKTARPLPSSESAHDMNNEFALAIKQMNEGYKTPQQALDDLALKWQAYL